ncbi:MAG: potassium transporter [Spirochaeta sp. LUC14_002_19_P3]|nr:MAG: potassium transporter [Spirochaeta sp. LUC14_002_19_P3]
MIRFGLVIYVVALLAGIIALFMIFPFIIALMDGDAASIRAFGITIILNIVLSSLIYFVSKKRVKHKSLRVREGFMLVTMSWAAASAIGAVPFVLSGAIPSYTNAFFETISGFTTTGASILTEIESLPRAVLFWRSLTHWLGGMGIVVLTVAILPFLGAGGVQLVRAESPGPTLDKMAPNITQTAKILWYIYLGFTVLEIILLMLGGMNWFDSLTHTFGTLATGGFSTKNASVGAYNSAYFDWVITIFMIMAGMNFGLFHKLLRGRFRDILKNTEFVAYAAIVAFASLFITGFLIKTYGSFGNALRYAAFQVASIITTTGYATADFELWPAAAKGMLFLMMFIGGCSGSTGGGPKVIRVVGLLKLALNEMKYLARPRGVFRIRLDGNPVKKDFIYSISGFFMLYFTALMVVTLIVTSFGSDIITGFTSALATVGNIGPGFGMVGPAMNYSFFHPIVKWVLSAAMLIGRLEVYTVIILLTPSFWSRR